MTTLCASIPTPARRRACFTSTPKARRRALRSGRGSLRRNGTFSGGGRGANRGGSLKVVTTHIRPGYLRKNGVPYSADAVLTEFYSRTMEPNGDSWLIVTTIVEDPKYLTQPFITSTHFRRQADAAGWNPQPCTSR